MRVWIDLTNSAHVLVLRPMVELLERDGHEVTLTARPLSHTLELLEDWGHPHRAIGRYGGAGRIGKARAVATRVAKLVRFARRRGFDYALAHGSAELPAACRLLGIANTTMFDYEWATLQHRVNCRLATRALAPEAIPLERLARLGVRPPKLVRYPGLKEEYYLSDFEPDPRVLDQLGVDRTRILCVVRTAPSYALYLRHAREELLPRVLRRLSEAEEAQTVVLARTPEQARSIAALGLDRVIAPERAVDGRTLVALADVLVSGGGTMNREAAVLGTPAWTIFEGPLGAVDEMLLREGRLRVLRDPAQIRLEEKSSGATRARRRRDPSELLRLAVPGAAAR
jgi:predicted glycosyltransferase